MPENFLVKARRKLDLGPGTALRLLAGKAVHRRPIVIVNFQGSLGDLTSFCATLPALRERHPDCQLLFFTSREYLELVRATRLVDLAAAPYGLLYHLAQKLCEKGAEYVPTEIVAAQFSGRQTNPPIHTATHFAQLLGVNARLDEVRLHPSPRLREDMARRLARENPEGRPIVVVHTGPTWTVKEWPEKSWLEWSNLVQRDLRVRVVQIGSETSSSKLHNHAMRRLPGAVDWVNQLSIMESVTLISQSQAFLGIDSGPLHLATLLGIPTVGLFGPVIGQYRAHPRAPFICLAADVPCLGCHHDPAGELHWRTGCPYDIRCMRDLAPAAVFAAVRDALAAVAQHERT